VEDEAIQLSRLYPDVHVSKDKKKTIRLDKVVPVIKDIKNDLVLLEHIFNVSILFLSMVFTF
jgi:hypothetical protein